MTSGKLAQIHDLSALVAKRKGENEIKLAYNNMPMPAKEAMQRKDIALAITEGAATSICTSAKI